MQKQESTSFGLNLVTANRFYVGMESTISASFSECQGLGVKVKYETYQEGGVNDQQRIFLGQSEFSEVTLKRGLSDDLVFWQWASQVMKPDKSKAIERRNINILVFNQAGETMQCWTLIGAVPVGWKAPSLTADSSSVAIEELTLAYEGVKIAKSGTASATSLKGRQNGYFGSN
ncbi:phage tail protein [Calothrix sp. 336/3]|uniref:phage tail protein n=1 Tax=Calothrix sp. 336/3 TaxID=1337936 RepID=UPI0004E46ACB|nr:phage tail protein [Calothrix sp. 336/3]AKG20502.1 phage tail protein [Calothrix sp. 336/3]